MAAQSSASFLLAAAELLVYSVWLSVCMYRLSDCFLQCSVLRSQGVQKK